MKIHNIGNILFDLDGTLTNPKEGIVNSILYALKKLDIEERSIDELDNFIGPPLRDSLMVRYHLTDSIAHKAVTLYREYFSTNGLFENEIYKGVFELLELLSAQKYQLFVATSKPTVFAEQILKHFKIDKYFKAIIGSNLNNTRTDKTEIISHILSVHDLQARNSIMVGDRKYDIIGAKNNAMQSIGVTYGYGSLEEISTHQPDFIVNNCWELESIFSN